MGRWLVALVIVLCLTACGGVAATVTPVPTATVSIGPTQTRAAELAQLATAQASPRPVVVIVATDVPPTADASAAAYLSAAQNDLATIHAEITPVVRACAQSNGGDCLDAYETAWAAFQRDAATVQALHAPTQCRPLNTAVQHVVDVTGNYLVTVYLLGTNGSSERAFEDGVLAALKDVNAAFDAANTAAQTGECR